MARVQIQNIKKSYGSVVALQDISLDIPTGSFFTLLGPSGCGKTTLLRTLAGFHQQDQGTLLVDDHVLDHTPVHKRNIGMVFQDYAIFPHLSVRKNVAFGLKQQKVARRDIRQRVDNILEVVQLEMLAERMPHELSGGQQQRVGLARALVTNPEVLLMDEPLSNLDAQLRIDLRRELRTIQQRLGITTVYVTHDQEEALEMSDFVCVMHKGIIQQSDTPWTIYHRPANRFVASFVGSNNFLPVANSLLDGEQNSGVPSACDCRICGVSNNLALGDLPSFSGSEAVVSIRPEHIRLDLEKDQNTDSSVTIRLPAKVRYQSFAGRELRLTLSAPDGSEILVITEPRPEFVALPEGAQVHLLLDKKDMGFYQADESGLRL